MEAEFKDAPVREVYRHRNEVFGAPGFVAEIAFEKNGTEDTKFMEPVGTILE